MMKHRAPILAVLLGLLCWRASALPSLAHMQEFASATATVKPDGRYAVDLTFDVLAFVLDESPDTVMDFPMNELLDGPDNVLGTGLDAAKARFKNEFAVLENQRQGTVDSMVFPSLADIQRHKDASPLTRLPVMLMTSLEGSLPAGARSVAFRFPSKLGMVSLTLVRPDLSIDVMMVTAGVPTDPVPIKLEGIETTPNPDAPPARAIAGPSRWKWAKMYVKLGFIHILPRGLDHILFILGLFLLGNRFRPLLLQITAFTVAHSITLALSMYGVFSLPPKIVEPLIALSIAFVALENIFTANLHRWRVLVVFGFGLIHGLGFASVLTDLGLPRREFVTALVAFNLGVEGGQLAVIALALLAVGWWRNRPWYRRAIVFPASGSIAAIGLFWAIQRTLLYYH